MSQIFTGSGLGLQGSSLYQLGSHGPKGFAALGQSGMNVYINAANGNVVLTRKDGYLATQGMGFSLINTYNSQATSSAWRFNNQSHLLFDANAINKIGNSITRIGDDGHQEKFIYDDKSKIYRSLDNTSETIRWSGESWEYLDGTSSIRVDYNSSGLLTRLYDADGHQLSCKYEADQLVEMVDTSGRQRIVCQFKNYLLQDINFYSEENLIHHLHYDYDQAGRLTRVTHDQNDGKIYWSAYDYVDDSNLIKQIRESDGSQLSFAYDQQGRITKLVDGEGRLTQFYYEKGFTRVSDGNGAVWQYSYDDNGHLIAIDGPSATAIRYEYSNNHLTCIRQGSSVWRYEYNDVGDCILLEEPNGQVIHRQFDKEHHILSEAVENLKHDFLNTNYSIYDEKGHLRFALSADGTVTEYRYDTYGLCSSQRVYLSKGFIANDRVFSPTLQELEAWVRLQSASPIQLTEYHFDWRGLLNEEIEYQDIDSEGKGISKTAIRTLFQYDARGRLVQKSSLLEQQKYSQYFLYDDCDRLILKTDNENASWRFEYDDINHRLLETDARGLQTLYIYDKSGLLLSRQSLSSTVNYGIESYQYDNNGQLIAKKELDGSVKNYFYDQEGRLVGLLLGDHLQEYLYDERDLLIKTIDYAQKVINPKGLSSLDMLRPTQTDQDRTKLAFYNHCNQLIYQIDASGAVIEYVYDANGKLAEKIAYAQRISSLSLVSPRERIHSNANDRHYFYYWDIQGRLIAEVNSVGTATTYQYNRLGQCIEICKLAIKVLAERGESWDEVKPISSEEDIHHYLIYNNKGLKIAEIDGEGYVKTYSYNSLGLLSQKKEWANAIEDYHLGQNWDIQTLVDSNNDHQTDYEYNDQGWLIQETSSNGLLINYHYDTTGLLLEKNSVDAKSLQNRNQLFRYDDLGRLIASLDARGCKLLQNPYLTDDKINEIWQNHAVHYHYDQAGRLIGRTNSLQQKEHYIYSDQGLLCYRVDAAGSVVEHQYNNFGELVLTRKYVNKLTNVEKVNISTIPQLMSTLRDDRHDEVNQWEYNSLGQISHQWQNFGTETYINYSSFAEIEARLMNPGSGIQHKITYAYDKQGALITEQDQSNKETLVRQWQYDQFGRLQAVLDARSNKTHYEFNKRGERVEVFNPAGNYKLISYDAFGRIVFETDYNHSVVSVMYSYDDKTNQITILHPATNSKIILTHNSFGEKLSSITSNGAETHWQYDEKGQLIEKTLPNGNTVNYEYDEAGRLIFTVDENAIEITYSYDPANKVISKIIDAKGIAIKTSYAYDGIGRQLKIIDAIGVTTTFEYDNRGNLIKSCVDPDGLNLITVFQYDINNLLILQQKENEKGQPEIIHYERDAFGRIIKKIIDPDGLALATCFEYDENNNLIRETDARGNTQLWIYNALNECRFRIDSLGFVTEQRFNANGYNEQTIKYNNSLGQLKNYSEAEIKNLIVEDEKDIHLYRQYNSEGQLLVDYDAQGYATTYRYDKQGNIFEIIHYASPTDLEELKKGNRPKLNSAGARYAYFAYDQLDRLIYQWDEKQILTEFIYGHGNLLLQKRVIARALNLKGKEFNAENVNACLQKTIDDQEVNYCYDSAGRLKAQLSAEGYATVYDYDGLNHLIKTHRYEQCYAGSDNWLEHLQISEKDRIINSVFDPAGREIYRISGEGRVIQRIYDDLGNVISEISYSEPVKLAHYSKEHLESVLSSIAKRNSKFTYDAASRLIQQTNINHLQIDYSYDLANNLIKRTENKERIWRYEYDEANQLIASYSPEVVITEYVNGQWQQSIRSIKTENNYDSFGRLIQVVKDVDQAKQRRNFEYDKNGRCIAKIFPDAMIDAATGPSGIRQEIKKKLIERTTYNGFGEIVAQMDRAGNWQYYTYDNGYLRFSLNKEGALTEYNYNQLGQLSSKTAYATMLSNLPDRINTANLEKYKKVCDKDRHEFYQYDRQNRLIKTQKDKMVFFNAAQRTYGFEQPTTICRYNAFDEIAENYILHFSDDWNENHYYYDNDGLIIAKLDGENYLTHFLYNGYAEQVEQIEYCNKATGDKKNYVLPPSNEGDRITQFCYDDLGRLSAKKQCRVKFQTLNEKGKIENLQQDLVTYYEYDAFNQLTQQKDALGNISYYVYDSLGQLQTKVETHTTNEHAATSYGYDGLGHLVSMIRHANSVSTPNAGHFFIADSAQDIVNYSFYNNEDQLLVSTDALNNTVNYSYDSQGNIARSWQIATTITGQKQIIDKRYFYDKESRQLRVATYRANGTISSENYSYTAFGELATKNNNQKLTIANEYDQLGRIWRTNSAGYYQILVYDLTDKLTQIVSSTNNFNPINGEKGFDLSKSEFTDLISYQDDEWAYYLKRQNNVYNHLGYLQEQYSESAQAANPRELNTIRQSYVSDRWGNITEHTNGRGFTTQYYYNVFDKVYLQELPTTLVCDEQGAQHLLKPTMQFAYDALGREIGFFDANGYQHTKLLNAQGLVVKEWDGKGFFKEKIYNILEQLQESITELGGITYYYYDKNNQLIRIVNPTSLQINTYNELGQLIEQRNTADDKVQFIYDELGQLSSRKGELGLWRNYFYDEAGHKVGEMDEGGTLQTWEYNDRNGQLEKHSDLAGRVTTYQYNLNGLLLEETSTAGRHIAYHYQGDGRLIEFADLARQETIDYQYDNDGNLINKQTSHIALNQTIWEIESEHYFYDSLDRLKSFQRVRPEDKDERFPDKEHLIIGVDYSYDAAGNLIHSAVLANSSGYDPVLREEYFTYDENNRLVINKGILLNGKITLSQSQGSIQGYDAGGNLIVSSKFEQGSLQQYTYGYNLANQHIWTKKNQILLQTKQYNNVGEVIEERRFDQKGNVAQINYSFYQHGFLTQFRTSAVSRNQIFDVSYAWFTYDNVGNLRSEIQRVNPQLNQAGYYIKHFYDYEKWDSYQRSWDVVYLQIDGQIATSGKSQRLYDQNGLLQMAIDQQPDANGLTNTNLYWTSAREGVRARQDRNGTTHYLSIDGHLIGDLQLDGNGKQQLNIYGGFSPEGHFTSTTSPTLPGEKFTNPFIQLSPGEHNEKNQELLANTPSEGIGNYTVEAGDTLESIALKIFGDSSLWYVLADANGIMERDAQPGKSSELHIGQKLILPAICSNTHQSATTQLIISEQKLQGNTSATPALKFSMLAQTSIKQNKHHHLFAKIATGVVTAITTVVAAAISASFLGLPLATSVGGLLKTGLAVLNGSVLSSGATLVIGAEAGLAGSLSGQAVANFTGLQHGVDWGAALMAALATAASVGLMRGFRTKWGEQALDFLQKESPAEFNLANSATAITQDLTNQTLALSLGQQQRFDWGRLGTNGVLGGLMAGETGQKINEKLTEIDHQTNILGKELNSGLTAASKAFLHHKSFNITSSFAESSGQILADAIIGQAIAADEEDNNKEGEYNYKLYYQKKILEEIKQEKISSAYPNTDEFDYDSINDLIAYGKEKFNEEKYYLEKNLSSLKKNWEEFDEQYHIIDAIKDLKFEQEEEPPTLFERGLSIGIEFIPVLGQLKAVNELWTGKDLITNEIISRPFTALSLIPGGAITLKTLKWLTKTQPAITILEKGKVLTDLGYKFSIKKRLAEGIVSGSTSLLAAECTADEHPWRSAASGFIVGSVYVKSAATIRMHIKYGAISGLLSNILYQSPDVFSSPNSINIHQLAIAGYASGISSSITHTAPLLSAAVLKFIPETGINKIGHELYEKFKDTYF